MDEYSVKRAANELVVPRRGLRDTPDNRDKNVQYCTRPGCSGRLNSAKSTRIGSTEKSKPFRPTFTSSNGKELVGSSSMTTSAMTSMRKLRKESHKKSFSKTEDDPSETSSFYEEPEVSEQMQSSAEHQPRSNSARRDTGSSEVTFTEVGCSTGASSSGPRKILCHKSGSSSLKSSMGSSVSSPFKATSAGTRVSSSWAGNGLRNGRCNSTSDVLPPCCSPAESRVSRRDIVKRRNSEGDSSSSVKGKKGELLKERHVFRPTRGISIADSGSSRNSNSAEGNCAVSVRTRGSMNVNTRLRDPMQDSLTKSSGLMPNLPRPGTPNPNVAGLSSQSFTDSSSSDYSSNSLPGNYDDHLPSVVPFTSGEVGINRFMNRDVLQQYNMDGVAQVLLALERIEQDEELSYERLLALETNLFLTGLSFYDQHRDMRLDIDNMSYEELLALEERMGSVSTALPEDALSKCLRRSTYQAMASETEAFGADGDVDDVKCSICQEEYVIGDDIGNLECEHGYHVECIKQWFKLKNWCPICKTTAAPSPESSKAQS